MLNEYLHSHENLQCEIENQTGTVHRIETNNLQMEDKSFDDVDIPSSAIIHDMLGVEVHELSQSANH
jgi:hypothetical protein